jgi:hypothetical protein
MSEFPKTLDEAIAQARSATQAALTVGYTRLQVELLLPELKQIELAYQYLPALADLGEHLKIFFTDAGAAALARRNWQNLPHPLRSLDIAGSRQTTPAEELVEPQDQAFLFVAPSAVEVSLVEKICALVGDRPVILFNPRLEDVGTIGLGYTARKLRERFLVTFEPCYYLRPLGNAALLRFYPSPWQVWLENGTSYEMVGEELQKPDSEKLDAILLEATGTSQQTGQGFLTRMQQFLNALGR